MMAPTGKAAARLAESIRNAKSADGPITLNCSDSTREAIPEEAKTIHRALGFLPGKPMQFKYGVENPLPADVVIVDEASMVDIALMTKLVEAVPPDSMLILLGDEHQLASVEAGAVFGDIATLKKTVHLTHSHRFGLESGIGALASAINAGSAERVLSELEKGDLPGVELIEMSDPRSIGSMIEPYVKEHYSALAGIEDPLRRLERFNEFRILAAHRRGLAGAEGLNRAAEDTLRLFGALQGRGEWYDGRPVLITRNDYRLKLFNGDVGLVCRRVSGSQELSTIFDSGDGNARWFDPSRLTGVETVYAMTVHKAQGSEFDSVLVVLPETRSPVVTRELLYTAVTRARKKVTLIAKREVLVQAIETPTERTSGLARLLGS
jgi:exodeoxyribonuclease V alpha subunit